MTLTQVLALLRRVHGARDLLLDPDSLELLRAVLEQHEAEVREHCARLAEHGNEHSLTAQLIAAAIREECT